MIPDDPRHGTYAGYIAGCREECCRGAARRYQRQRYFDRAVLGLPPRFVNKVGSKRRVNALQALGWSAEDLSVRMGFSRAYLNVAINREGRDYILRATARRIADIYDELSMTFPPETPCTSRQRAAAKKKGWLPPLAWDDDRIDDPNYRPNLTETDHDIDPVVIERILAGDRIPATVSEKFEVTRQWLAMGRSLGQLERQTGWNSARYVTREEGAA